MKKELSFLPLLFDFCSGNKVKEGKVMGWKVKTFVKSENIFSCLEDDLKINGKMTVFQVFKNISR